MACPQSDGKIFVTCILQIVSAFLFFSFLFFLLTVNFQRSLYPSVSLQILLAAFSRSVCSQCSSLHRFRLHFICGILFLPLYMFVSSVSWLYLHRNLRSIRVVGTVYLSRLLSAQVLSLCFAITVIYVKRNFPANGVSTM